MVQQKEIISVVCFKKSKYSWNYFDKLLFNVYLKKALVKPGCNHMLPAVTRSYAVTRVCKTTGFNATIYVITHFMKLKFYLTKRHRRKYFVILFSLFSSLYLLRNSKESISEAAIRTYSKKRRHLKPK